MAIVRNPQGTGTDRAGRALDPSEYSQRDREGMAVVDYVCGHTDRNSGNSGSALGPDPDGGMNRPRPVGWDNDETFGDPTGNVLDSPFVDHQRHLDEPLSDRTLAQLDAVDIGDFRRMLRETGVDDREIDNAVDRLEEIRQNRRITGDAWRNQGGHFDDDDGDLDDGDLDDPDDPHGPDNPGGGPDRTDVEDPGDADGNAGGGDQQGDHAGGDDQRADDNDNDGDGEKAARQRRRRQGPIRFAPLGADVPDWARGVNPWRGARAGDANCVSCTDALIRRRRGEPDAVAARGLPKSRRQIGGMEDAYGGSFEVVGESGLNARMEIGRILTDADDGAMGIVHCERPQGPDDLEPPAGHTFYAENDGGVIRFVDGQRGTSASFAGEYPGEFVRFRFMLLPDRAVTPDPVDSQLPNVSEEAHPPSSDTSDSPGDDPGPATNDPHGDGDPDETDDLDRDDVEGPGDSDTGANPDNSGLDDASGGDAGAIHNLGDESGPGDGDDTDGSSPDQPGRWRRAAAAAGRPFAREQWRARLRSIAAIGRGARHQGQRFAPRTWPRRAVRQHRLTQRDTQQIARTLLRDLREQERMFRMHGRHLQAQLRRVARSNRLVQLARRDRPGIGAGRGHTGGNADRGDQYMAAIANPPQPNFSVREIELAQRRVAAIDPDTDPGSDSFGESDLIVRFQDGSLGIYRPRLIEEPHPFHHIPVGRMGHRMVATSRVAELLDSGDIVPTTIWWDDHMGDGIDELPGWLGPGTLQHRVPGAMPGAGIHTRLADERAAILRYITGNVDPISNSSGDHIGPDGIDQPLLVNNGGTFPLRTPETFDMPIALRDDPQLSDEALAPVRALDPDVLRRTLEDAGIEPEAIDAAMARFEEIRTRGRITGDAWRAQDARIVGRDIDGGGAGDGPDDDSPDDTDGVDDNDDDPGDDDPGDDGPDDGGSGPHNDDSPDNGPGANETDGPDAYDDLDRTDVEGPGGSGDNEDDDVAGDSGDSHAGDISPDDDDDPNDHDPDELGHDEPDDAADDDDDEDEDEDEDEERYQVVRPQPRQTLRDFLHDPANQGRSYVLRELPEDFDDTPQSRDQARATVELAHRLLLELEGERIVDIEWLDLWRGGELNPRGASINAFRVTYEDGSRWIVKWTGVEPSQRAGTPEGWHGFNEVATWEGAVRLGLTDVVPETRFLHRVVGLGSRQRWIDNMAPGRRPAAYSRRHQQMVAVVHYAFGVTDHHMRQIGTRYERNPETGELERIPVSVDHGYSHPLNTEDPIESSFVVDWLDEPLDDDILAALDDVNLEDLRDDLLQAGLDPEQIDGDIARLQEIIDNGRITGETWFRDGGRIVESNPGPGHSPEVVAEWNRPLDEDPPGYGPNADPDGDDEGGEGGGQSYGLRDDSDAGGLPDRPDREPGLADPDVHDDPVLNRLDGVVTADGGSNCADAALAADLRLGGHGNYVAGSRPAGAPSSIDGGDTLHLDTFDAHYSGEFRHINRLQDLEDELLAAGPGARGILGDAGPTSYGDGHVINVVNDDGTIRYIDCSEQPPRDVTAEMRQQRDIEESLDDDDMDVSPYDFRRTDGRFLGLQPGHHNLIDPDDNGDLPDPDNHSDGNSGDGQRYSRPGDSGPNDDNDDPNDHDPADEAQAIDPDAEEETEVDHVGADDSDGTDGDDDEERYRVVGPEPRQTLREFIDDPANQGRSYVLRELWEDFDDSPPSMDQARATLEDAFRGLLEMEGEPVVRVEWLDLPRGGELNLRGASVSAFRVTYADGSRWIVKWTRRQPSQRAGTPFGWHAQNEVATWEGAVRLGLTDVLPETRSLSPIPGMASRQRWIDNMEPGRQPAAYSRRHQQMVAVLHYGFAVTDHHMRQLGTRYERNPETGELERIPVSVDHGYSHPLNADDPIESSFVVDWLDEPLDDDILAALDDVNLEDLRDDLRAAGLTDQQIDGDISRIQEIIDNGRITGETWRRDGGEIIESHASWDDDGTLASEWDLPTDEDPLYVGDPDHLRGRRLYVRDRQEMMARDSSSPEGPSLHDDDADGPDEIRDADHREEPDDDDPDEGVIRVLDREAVRRDRQELADSYRQLLLTQRGVVSVEPLDLSGHGPGGLRGATDHAFLVTLDDGSRWIVKLPTQPTVRPTTPYGTHDRNEVATWDGARCLGLGDLLSETRYVIDARNASTMRRGVGGGAMQRWIDGLAPGRRPAAYPRRHQQGTAILHYVFGVTDHHMRQFGTRYVRNHETGELERVPVSLDHGYTHPDNNSDDTIESSFVVDWLDEPLDEDVLAALSRAANQHDLYRALRQNRLTTAQIDGDIARLQEILDNGRITGDTWFRDGGRIVESNPGPGHSPEVVAEWNRPLDEDPPGYGPNADPDNPPDGDPSDDNPGDGDGPDGGAANKPSDGGDDGTSAGDGQRYGRRRNDEDNSDPDDPDGPVIPDVDAHDGDSGGEHGGADDDGWRSSADDELASSAEWQLANRRIVRIRPLDSEGCIQNENDLDGLANPDDVPLLRNELYLADLDDGTQAIFKPETGELDPLINAPITHGTLADRDVSAFRWSEDLDIGAVPPTARIDYGPIGRGSNQLRITNARPSRWAGDYDVRHQQGMAVLHAVIAAMDHHYGNVLEHGIEPDSYDAEPGSPASIDNANSMPDVAPGTVLNPRPRPIRSPFVWLWRNRPLDADLIARLEAIDRDWLRRRQRAAGMSDDAIDGAIDRLDRICRDGMITDDIWPGKIIRVFHEDEPPETSEEMRAYAEEMDELFGDPYEGDSNGDGDGQRYGHQQREP